MSSDFHAIGGAARRGTWSTSGAAAADRRISRTRGLPSRPAIRAAMRAIYCRRQGMKSHRLQRLHFAVAMGGSSRDDWRRFAARTLHHRPRRMLKRRLAAPACFRASKVASRLFRYFAIARRCRRRRSPHSWRRRRGSCARHTHEEILISAAQKSACSGSSTHFFHTAIGLIRAR